MKKEDALKLIDENIENTIITINKLIWEGQASEALNLCLKLLKFNAKDSRFWRVLGNCYYFLKRFDESIHSWQIAHNLDPGNLYSDYFNIGQALMMTGNLIDGFALYQLRLPLFLNDYPQETMWKGENVSGKTLLILHDDG